jgi:hypothetical protein
MNEIGWILDTSGSWTTVFGVASAIYFIGGVIYLSLAGSMLQYTRNGLTLSLTY